MEMQKLLIADTAEEFTLALADALRGAYDIYTCQDGRNALELLHSIVPDVVVLELMLPELDGISLLQQAAAAGICPMVLVASRFVSDYVLEAAEALGVGYVMRKPCDVKATAVRVLDLAQRIRTPPAEPPDPKTVADDRLQAMGFSPRLRGYPYLLDAVTMMVANPELSMTKELYPTIAKQYRIRWEQVERCIRTSISSAWSRRDPRLWNVYFPPEGDAKASRPTNGEFICRMAEILAPELIKGAN